MELGPNIFDDILMPSSAFSVIEPSIASAAQPTDGHPWLESSTNPINMLDRLPQPSQEATWRVDGGEGHIGRLFAVPDFAVSGTLLRIDVFLPPLQSIRDPIQDVLQLKTLFSTRSSDIPHHTVAKYLVAGLEHWTSLNPGFQRQYEGMPFGSQLVVTRLGTGIASMKCELHPNYNLEAQMLSIPRLNAAWQLPPNSWPTVVDVTDLELVKQAHESISLVRLRNKGDGRLYVFKSNIEDPKYLYHELRVLLTMPSHPNIVGQPECIVTKRCRFGGKVGVCGFILPYYSGGSLRDRLRREGLGYVWPLKYKLRYAIQIASAIKHVARQPLSFYSDLKIDNVVFTSDTADADAILIEFEQRGASYVWEPPEIFSFDVLDWVASFGREQQAVERCQTLLRRCLSGWEPRTKAINLHTAHPYNTPWLALHEAEREKAQVFMLGKVLWCVFEGLPDLGGILDIASLQHEQQSTQRFPQFQHSPPALRELILRCTSGAPENQHDLPAALFRSGKIYPRSGSSDEPKWLASGADTQIAIRRWWQEELKKAERFVCHRFGFEHDCDDDGYCENVMRFARERPDLAAVLESLMVLHATLD